MGSRIALVSDVVMKRGGAEKVLEQLLVMFPEADLYTLLIVPSARKKIRRKYPRVTIHTSIFQVVVNRDRVTKYVSIIKMFSWLYWEVLDLKNYSLIISSSHSFMSKNVKKGNKCLYLAYVHTTPRYLYDEFCEIGWIKRNPWRWLLAPMMVFLRWIDKKGASRPDVLIANSRNVRNRIEKYYGKQAIVVYPPVKLKTGRTIHIKQNYYICLSRLVKQKGIELAIKVCNRNHWPLVVVGDGPELNRLVTIGDQKIRFVSRCGEKKKIRLIAGAKALIYPSIEEDFGIVPIEAMRLGVPVVAWRSGGVEESLVDGVTGVLFDDYSEEGLTGAVRKLDKIKVDPRECISQSQKFNEIRFQKEILAIIKRFGGKTFES